MQANTNGLTPAQAERLAMLAEECGEVVQVIGKILRHGYDSRHPNGGPTNKELLAAELRDVDAVVRAMGRYEMRDFSMKDEVGMAWDKKRRFAHHQEDCVHG